MVTANENQRKTVRDPEEYSNYNQFYMKDLLDGLKFVLVMENSEVEEKTTIMLPFLDLIFH